MNEDLKYPFFEKTPRKPFDPDVPFGLIRDARGGFTLIGAETIQAIQEGEQKNKRRRKGWNLLSLLRKRN